MTDTQFLTWAELCRDERWKAVARQVRQRAGYRCEECGAEGVRLDAHHTYYVYGRAPWEYPEESLRCWCDGCHKLHHVIAAALRRAVGALSLAQLWQVLGYARGAVARSEPPSLIPQDVADCSADGFGDAWWLPGGLIEEMRAAGPVTTVSLWAARRARNNGGR